MPVASNRAERTYSLCQAVRTSVSSNYSNRTTRRRNVNPLKSLTNSALSRRTFLAGAGTTAAATLAGCSSNNTPAPITIPPPTAGTEPTYTPTDILNFALNLEYLEAEFYLYAATGSGIPAADAGSGAGTTIGGAMIPNLTPAQQQIVNIIAQDEYNHVKFLRAALTTATTTPVPRPNINFTAAFSGLGSLATGGKNTTFNPFSSFNNWLIGGFTFEDVGVTAYHGGAAPLQMANSPFLGPAAQILAVEAYHAAILRTLIVGTSLPAAGTPNVAGDQTYLNLAIGVQQVRATLSGGGTLSAGEETMLSSGLTYSTATPPTAPTVGASSIVAADSNAVAFSRTVDQVLHIVYATGTSSAGYPFGITSGGFFPNGLNGNIKQTYT